MPTDTLPLLEQRLLAIASDREQGGAFERALVAWINAGGHSELKRAWLWSDWPERTARGLGVDKGIDLVAEGVDGALVAIQAKFRRAPDDPVTAPEVQKLVGAYRKHFQFFALASNAWAATRGVAETVGDGAMLILREELLAADYDWAAQRPLSPPPFTPFPFQLEAAENIRSALVDGGRAQIVMACGTGKTVTMLLATEALDAERVLVLAPTLLLVKQLRDEWVAKRQADRPWASLAVCSDIGKDYDATDLSPAELGVPATTDPGRIAEFLRAPGRRVVFGTYASSDRIAQAQRDTEVPAFDLAVADEAHRIAGVVAARNVGERSQRVILEDAQIRATRRLFATATPRVTAAARTRDADEVLIESMDDPARFGAVVHSVTFQQAVQLERLVPYKLIVMVVTEGEVAESIRDRSFVDVAGATFPADTVATAIAMRRAYGELGITRIISYHARVEAARAFAELIRRLPGPGTAPTTEHVAGTMPVNDRKRVLRRLAEATGPYLVTNARCLTEGIDVPALDAVAFVDPRRSQVDIVQAVGRAMRRPVGGSAKTTGYIVLPVFLTTVELGDPEAAVEGTAFEPVLRVLRALKDHDPFMARFMAKVLVEAGERPAARGEGIDQILEVSLGKALDRVLAERLLAAVRLHALEVAADLFERNLELLRRFVEREGHARVEEAWREGGVALGRWVGNIRTRRKCGTLRPRHVECLDALGFVWNVHDSNFEQSFALLEAFVTAHGHARVPAKFRAGEAFLGRWVNKVRTGHISVSEDRKKRLDALGFVWDVLEDSYSEKLAALSSFVRREGHARVPVTHIEQGLELGRWVRKTRARKNSLPPARLADLDALGFVWDAHADQFEQNFSALQRFVNRTGHARVPGSYREGEVALGDWVVTLRVQRDRLQTERRERLDALGFVWDPFEADFLVGVNALTQFVRREGHARVSQNHSEGDFGLGGWVARIRQRRRVLSDERAALLDKLGFVWAPRADDFEAKIKVLQRYAANEGHACIAKDCTWEGVPLGGWAQGLRARRESLTPERVARLNEIGFVWELREDSFADNLILLEAYVRRVGDARVPQDHIEQGVALGTWVDALRAARERLSDTRVRQLNALGFIWQPLEEVFERNLEALRQFVTRTGGGLVPKDHVEGDIRLGLWVNGLRQKREQLTPERIARLDEFGFVWNAREDRFATNFRLLKKFIARERHALVPAGHLEGGLKLGVWVSTVRARRAQLPASRAAALDDLGFVWDPDQAAWDGNVDSLRRFVAVHGHARVPASYIVDGIRLGNWVANLRRRRAGLSPERFQQLASLSFVWDPFEEQFHRNMALLTKFVASNFHAQVPQTWQENGERLGAWVAKIRSKRSTLPPDRIAQLDALGFVWSVKKEKP